MLGEDVLRRQPELKERSSLELWLWIPHQDWGLERTQNRRLDGYVEFAVSSGWIWLLESLAAFVLPSGLRVRTCGCVSEWNPSETTLLIEWRERAPYRFDIHVSERSSEVQELGIRGIDKPKARAWNHHANLAIDTNIGSPSLQLWFVEISVRIELCHSPGNGWGGVWFRPMMNKRENTQTMAINRDSDRATSIGDQGGVSSDLLLTSPGLTFCISKTFNEYHSAWRRPISLCHGMRYLCSTRFKTHPLRSWTSIPPSRVF